MESLAERLWRANFFAVPDEWWQEDDKKRRRSVSILSSTLMFFIVFLCLNVSLSIVVLPKGVYFWGQYVLVRFTWFFKNVRVSHTHCILSPLVPD